MSHLILSFIYWHVHHFKRIPKAESKILPVARTNYGKYIMVQIIPWVIPTSLSILQFHYPREHCHMEKEKTQEWGIFSVEIISLDELCEVPFLRGREWFTLHLILSLELIMRGYTFVRWFFSTSVPLSRTEVVASRLFWTPDELFPLLHFSRSLFITLLAWEKSSCRLCTLA